MKSLISHKAQPLRGAGDYKTTHIKGRRRAADCASKPPGRGKRMSGRQIFGHTWKESTRKAQTPPACIQPVPSKYGTWWGHGSEIREYGLVVGRREKTYFAAPAQTFLRGTSCWDDRPPKRSKVEGGIVRCMPLGTERESIYTVAGKGATVG